MKSLDSEVEIKNKVILLGVLLNNKKIDENEFLDDLEELKNLCESCEMEVLEKVSQNLHEINPKTYIGSGKIE